jgi:hypothetical protein
MDAEQIKPGVAMRRALEPKPKWRYRTDWRGRLILQIQPSIFTATDITRGEAERGCRNWRDATMADVTEGLPSMIMCIE